MVMTIKGGFILNDEGISPVLGSVLILAIGMTLLATVQLDFVPVWNAQEELDHLEKMNDDFSALKSSIEESAISGTTLSSPLSMGFQYSPKVIVYNPRDTAWATLSIQKDVWAEVRYNEMLTNGMDDSTTIKNISTSTITYTLHGAQNLSYFIYEHGLIRRSTSNYTSSTPTLLSNGTLYLLSVNATTPEITNSMESRMVNIYPTSQAENSVVGKNVWLRLRTRYPDWWTDSNNPGSIQNQGGTIQKIDYVNGIVIANFSSMVIRMGETQVTTVPKKPPAHLPPVRLVMVSPQNVNLPVTGISSLEVEVQDFYNNPVPNVQVNFSINSTRGPANAYSNATLSQSSAISGADGMASVQLTTNGPGLYYIDASLSAYTTTFVYPASSQSGFLSLSYAEALPNYIITATLKNGFGQAMVGNSTSFSAGSNATVTPAQNNTDTNGNTSTTLNTSGATGMTVKNIQVSGITNTSAIITWDTINTITVAVNNTNGGYIFNFINIPAKVNSTGCVNYGTVPGNYPNITCDSLNRSSHNVSLSLLSNTVYYFMVNSSYGGTNVNSTEYMFATGGVTSTTPPASVTNLTTSAIAPLYINWTWTDPTSTGFDHVQVYIDGAYVGNVAAGVQYFNATYFKPNSTHNMTTYTVDGSGNVNATGVYSSATTQSMFTYVFGFLNTTGTVTNFSSAQSDSGAYATFAEQQINAIGNRTINPGKTIANGTQGGTWNSSNLTSNDGSIDITIPAISGATAQTGYLMNTIKTGVGGTTYWNINGTNGTSANTSTKIGTSSLGTYVFEPGVQNNAAGTPGTNPAGYGWASSAPINGTTGAGNWSFQVKTSFNSSGAAGTISVYVYKYNATSGLSTYLFNAAGTANHLNNNSGTTENITSIIQPSYTFNSTEYLKVEYWLNITTVKSGKGLSFEVNSVYPFVKYATNSYSLNTTYNFSETNSSSMWQGISIQDSSYGDSLTNVSIFNATSGLWESILTSPFTGGTTSATHVNTTVGTSGNASSYNNSNTISLRYNYTNAAFNNSLGIDLINVTILYAPVYDLNITTNTTNIPNATTHMLQIKYNVSGDNFTLQLWNGSAWNNKTTLNNTLLSYYNITLTTSELILNTTLNGDAGNLNTFNLTARYLDVNASGGKLYLYYQRVNST